MGRPKGSKNKATAERTSQRMVREEVNWIAQGTQGIQPVKIVTEVERYTFKNIGQAMFFVTALHSNETKSLSPGEIRDDFTKKERDKILTSSLYNEGQIIEVFNDDLEEINNPNSLSDKQLDKILLLDNEDIKDYILKMDSIFSLNRIKERIMEQKLPAHLINYIDSRISELQKKYEDEQKAPVDSYKVVERRV